MAPRRRERRARADPPPGGTARPPACPAGKPAHGSAMSPPSSRASCAHCSSDMSAEWLAGWPWVGSPRALIVYAKITAGRSRDASARLKASSRSARSWPPRSAMAAVISASSRASISLRISRCPPASPGSRSRSSAAGLRRSRWYSSLLIESMRSRSASPPSRSNSRRSRRPYLTVIVSHPAASNIPRRRPAAMSGTTRSSDCRLRSTIQSTSPRRATMGSTSASQIAPSSSSASPTSATWRPPCGTSKCPAT